MTAARRAPEAAAAGACASPEEDLESVEDDDVTGVEARQKRKQRREAREAARLQRLAQKAAARRSGPSAEELRAQKIAEKAAARRAKAKGGGKPEPEKGTEQNEAAEEQASCQPEMDEGKPTEQEAAALTAQNGHSEAANGKNHKESEETPESLLCAESLAPDSKGERKAPKKEAGKAKQAEQAKADEQKEEQQKRPSQEATTGRKRKSEEQQRRPEEATSGRKRNSEEQQKRKSEEATAGRKRKSEKEDGDAEKKKGRRSRDRRRRAEDHKHRRSSRSRRGHGRHRRRHDSRDSGRKGARDKDTKSTREASRSRSAKRVARRANAISPPKPAKARPEVGARVKVLTENEDKEGLYYDDDRVGTKGMVGRIIEDDTSEQPFRVKLKNGKLSWFKEAWLEELEGGSSSSSSSSSSSDSSDNSNQNASGKGQSPEEAAAFAWERTPKNLPAAGLAAYAMNGANAISPLAAEVEAFLANANVDGEAAQRLRVMPAHQQRMVLDRGPVAGSRAPTGVLVARIRDAELGRAGPGIMGAIPMNGGPPSSNPEIEKLISKWSLDVKASWMLRSLPADKHEMALKISVDKARNPSAYVITQLNSLFGGIQGIQELQRMKAIADGNRDAIMMPKKNQEPNFNLTAVTL